jgi:hypothetical protein
MAVAANPGVLLVINGTDVALTPSSVGDYKKDGMHFELPEKVELGTLKNLNDLLTGTFDAPALPSADSFPGPLDKVYGTLTDLVLAIDTFTLDVPASLKADGTAIPDADRVTTFSLGISAALPGAGADIIPGKLAIKGIYLQIVKEKPTT